MPILTCANCGKEYDSMYSFHSCRTTQKKCIFKYLAILSLFILAQSYGFSALLSDLRSLEEYQGFLTVTGWILVFLFNRRTQKEGLKNEAKMRVYEEIHTFNNKLQSASVNLSIKMSSFGFPFLSMQYAGQREESEAMRNADAIKLWNTFVSELSDKIGIFVDCYLKLWVHCEMWIGVMPELKLAKKILFSEFSRLNLELRNYTDSLRKLSITNNNWREWNIEEIKQKADNMRTEFDLVFAYSDDFMGLIHNVLMAPILGYKKQSRETFNLERFNEPFVYKILTINGLEERKHTPQNREE